MILCLGPTPLNLQRGQADQVEARIAMRGAGADVVMHERSGSHGGAFWREISVDGGMGIRTVTSMRHTQACKFKLGVGEL